MLRHALTLTSFTTILACTGGTTTDKDDTDTDTVEETDTDVTVDTDCAGVVDDCGVCDGNNEDKDCDGVCFGDAVEDACGTCDADNTNDCQTSVTLVGGGWSCLGMDSCQDIFDVELAAGAVVTLAATEVTGDSVVRFAVFAPGQPVSSINILVGTRKDLQCTEQDEDATATFTAATAGTYKVAITRDWGESSGQTGTYELTISSPQGLPSGVMANGNDVVSQALGARCGNEYELTGGWNCARSEDCQDSYTFTAESGTNLEIVVTGVMGSSAIRHALYAPSVALGGVNLLTGNTDDFFCDETQDVGGSVYPSALATTGTYTYALTRDWGYSGGSSGTYTLTIGADAFFSRPEQVVDDVDSLAPNGSCPIR